MTVKNRVSLQRWWYSRQLWKCMWVRNSCSGLNLKDEKEHHAFRALSKPLSTGRLLVWRWDNCKQPETALISNMQRWLVAPIPSMACYALLENAWVGWLDDRSMARQVVMNGECLVVSTCWKYPDTDACSGSHWWNLAAWGGWHHSVIHTDGCCADLWRLTSQMLPERHLLEPDFRSSSCMKASWELISSYIKLVPVRSQDWMIENKVVRECIVCMSCLQCLPCRIPTHRC